MSYEGYEEYLCENGHHMERDVYDIRSVTECEYCKGKLLWRHSVDQTNGFGQHRHNACLNEEEYDHSYFDEPAPVVELGYEDQWHEDHYGNKYATKVMLYSPDLTYPGIWKEVERD
jgi:hypothetical protein